jgi:hypothetical protein
MAVDTERRAKKIASRVEHALLLQPIDTAMAFNPSHPNPEASAHVVDNSSTQSPMDHSLPRSSVAGQEHGAESPLLSAKKRRPSKSKVPGELRRTSSTPHMRNLALGNSGELSPTSNKARNKLGYHRTSVACGKLDLLFARIMYQNTNWSSQGIVGGERFDVFLLQKMPKVAVQTASA